MESTLKSNTSNAKLQTKILALIRLVSYLSEKKKRKKGQKKKIEKNKKCT